MHIAGLIAKIPHSIRHGYVGQAGVLIGGTLIARVIALAALVLISRIYTPAEFGLLAIFAGVVTILSVASCLRYEMAIPVAETEEEAANLAVAAFLSLVFVVLALVLALFIFEYVGHAPNIFGIGTYIWLVPVAVLAIGLLLILQAWSVRHSRFAQLALSRISQSISGSVASIGMGWVFGGPLGLFVGHILNQGGGSVSLLLGQLDKDKGFISRVTAVGVLAATKKYSRYPRFSSVEAIFHSSSYYVPLLILGSTISNAELGAFMLAMQVVDGPVTLISGAVTNLYASRSREKLKSDEFYGFTKRVLITVAKLGILPMLLAALLSPWLFPLVFGSQWMRAGELAVWVMPWMFLQLITLPVANSLSFIGCQKTALKVQSFGLFGRVLAIIIAGLVLPRHQIEIYAVSSFIFYLIYIAVILRVVKARGTWIAGVV